MNILTVIPCAGRPNNPIFPSYSNLPDCMIPINSKPVIGHILDDIISRDLKQVLILLNKNDVYTQRYVDLMYGRRLSIVFYYVQDTTTKLVGTIREGILSYSVDYESILIYLGDTVYKGSLDFSENFLTVKKEFQDSKQWCFVEQNNYLLSFINKPEQYSGNGFITTGLYFFKNKNIFKQTIEKILQGELYLFIEQYAKNEKFLLIDSSGWYDFGNIENYYQARLDFLKVRHFNSLNYNSVYGTIKKSSHNSVKINQEINWYLNMPYELKIFAPRLVDYQYGSPSSYEIEYYGYQSLGDMFLFGYVGKNMWNSIIVKLFDTLDLFKKYTTVQPYSFFYDMYVTKTYDRLQQLESNDFFRVMLGYETIVINGVDYKNIGYYMENLEKLVRSLYDSKDICFIHGDFCLSNIMYDTGSKIIKMIDPRGYFGEIGVYGDIKYDLAKLRHSFVGFYDFLVSDLFHVEVYNNEFSFNTYHNNIHSDISLYFDQELTKRGYDLNKIKLIESLLFLTMIPLHADNLERQKAMYCTAVLKFNSLISL